MGDTNQSIAFIFQNYNWKMCYIFLLLFSFSTYIGFAEDSSVIWGFTVFQCHYANDNDNNNKNKPQALFILVFFFEESLGWRALNPDSWPMTRRVIWYSFVKFAKDSPPKEREEDHSIVRSSKSILKNPLVEEFRNSSSALEYTIQLPYRNRHGLDQFRIKIWQTFFGLVYKQNKQWIDYTGVFLTDHSDIF